MKTLLEVKNLRVNFNLNGKQFTAVDGVDFNINESETVILSGESGSGKTITALSLTKNLPFSAEIISGSVVFEGTDLLKMDEIGLSQIRGAKISYIFQEPTSYLNPVFTIGSQITEAIILHQAKSKLKAQKDAQELLGMVKLKEPQRVLDSYPHQLSGGMNQRVFIAMALACRPKLLIADEPTTSLDVTVEAQILKLLTELKKEMGFSLLFITHNLSIAKRIADRIYVMYMGQIVECGSKESIFLAPKHAHTKELINAYERIGHL